MQPFRNAAEDILICRELTALTGLMPGAKLIQARGKIPWLRIHHRRGDSLAIAGLPMTVGAPFGIQPFSGFEVCIRDCAGLRHSRATEPAAQQHPQAKPAYSVPPYSQYPPYACSRLLATSDHRRL